MKRIIINHIIRRLDEIKILKLDENNYKLRKCMRQFEYSKKLF